LLHRALDQRQAGLGAKSRQVEILPDGAGVRALEDFDL
jgi:hypothetical protein